MSTKLNNLKRHKEDLVTNMKNLLYHATDHVELMVKKLQDVDMQLVECMEQIQKMAAEAELKSKELEELRTGVQVIVDVVDPPEEGIDISKTLLQHLREAPQKITGYISETTKTYVAHVLGLVKSYWLSHPIYKNINRAIIYAPGSSHAYIQQIIKISQHMSGITLI
jgi:hypothetical protein